MPTTYTPVTFEVTADEDRKFYKGFQKASPVWEAIIVALREGKTLRINARSREAIAAPVRRRGMKIHITKHPDGGFVVWEDNGTE